MKKIVLIFTVMLAVGMSASAFVDNQYMLTEQYLVNSGFSKEMAKAHQGITQDPYRENYQEPKTFSNAMRRTYWYIVPGAHTDYDFYNHSTTFNKTTWKDL